MSANSFLRHLVFLLLTWLIPLAASAVSFTNPLSGDTGINTIQDAILTVVRFMLYVTVALALGGIVFGGLKIIWPLNKEEHVKEGKKIITWSIVGLIIIILAQIIVRLVGTLLGATGANP